MKKVIIASRNPVKIQAVRNGFEQMFPDQEFEFIGLSVDSGVSDQPMSSIETFTGAKNRADNASIQDPDADFHIGIEGGIDQGDGEMVAFAWVVIKSNGTYGKSKTGTFYLPKQVVELVNQGKELGEADDIVFDRTNSKQKSGAVGILTGNVIDRTSYYTEAVILALIPFKNRKLY
jgi:inosine/xanthosine triphosphatase